MRIIMDGYLGIILGFVVALPIAFLLNTPDFWMTALSVYIPASVGLFGLFLIVDAVSLYLEFRPNKPSKQKGNH